MFKLFHLPISIAFLPVLHSPITISLMLHVHHPVRAIPHMLHGHYPVGATSISHVCSPVAQNSEGEQLIADMQKLLAVPVFAYSDIQGAHITEAGSDESGRYRDNMTTVEIGHKVPLIKICMLAVILKEP